MWQRNAIMCDKCAGTMAPVQGGEEKEEKNHFRWSSHYNTVALIPIYFMWKLARLYGIVLFLQKSIIVGIHQLGGRCTCVDWAQKEKSGSFSGEAFRLGSRGLWTCRWLLPNWVISFIAIWISPLALIYPNPMPLILGNLVLSSIITNNNQLLTICVAFEIQNIASEDIVNNTAVGIFERKCLYFQI